MQNCPGDGCFRANSRHWMHWIYEYTPLTKQTVLGVLFVLALIVAIAQNQPELLAHHWTEAGSIEKAASFWGKAGQRSLERSALVEAVAHLTRAVEQIATLPPSTSVRREQIKLQSALITPLIHVKGYAAPETKAAAEQTRLLIEQAEARGETPEDPLMWFSVLYGFSVVNFVAFNADAMRELAE
jgi:predicted ATPase